VVPITLCFPIGLRTDISYF
jgi:hypothetical protein